MGALADRIQGFVDYITSVTTAEENDVVQNKTYWKNGMMHTGSLSPIDNEAYTVNIAPNKKDINIIFTEKIYTLPSNIITISKSILEQILQREDIDFTDSDDDEFYLFEDDEDFYAQALLENYHIDVNNVCYSDDFLIDSTETHVINVDQTWINMSPSKEDLFTLVDDGSFHLEVNGNLVAFYDAMPDWELTHNGIDEVTELDTWIINEHAFQWIDKDQKIVGFPALKGITGDNTNHHPEAGRIYIPGNTKLIFSGIDDTVISVGNYTFRNTSIKRIGDDGVTVNQSLTPMTEDTVLYDANITGSGDLLDTTVTENFEVTGEIHIVKTLHAYQASANSSDYVVVIKNPFIFDFKYSSLVFVDDAGLHVAGGDTGISNTPPSQNTTDSTPTQPDETTTS